MREFLEEIAQAPDPVASARAGQRQALPKRFYREATVGEAEGGFRVLLDGRAVRTPARALLAVPTRALADLLVAEWAAQGAHIDPATMPLTRLVNVALDGVAHNVAANVAEVVSYAGSDLICYRAEGPEALVRRQGEQWDGVLRWFRTAQGAAFFLSEGIRHVAQPPESLARVDALVPRAPLQLAALVSMTGLTGSALLSLAVLHGALAGDAAWTAAHVDEDWNIDQWGADEAAAARRAARGLEMEAAVRLLGACAA